MISEALPPSTGISVKVSYDAASRLTGIVDTKGTASIATFSYTRDAAGLLAGATETGVPNPGSDTYTYTALNQLSGVNLGSYSYDAADNVTGLIVPSQVSLQYDSSNELIKLTSGTQVTNFNYDTRGNRLSRTPPSGPALTYIYDQANRMTAFGTNATYQYAGDGLRMSKIVGTATEAFTWERSGTLPLLIMDGTTNYVYGPDGSPLEQVNGSGTALFYLHDQIGSTRLLVNSSGAVQASYRRGRRTLATATADPTTENFHQFRTRAKTLWYQLRILRPVNPVVLKTLSDDLHSLGDLLGRAHDLSFLAERLRSEHGKSKWEREGQRLLAVIEVSQHDLQRGATELAEHFFAERPRDFSSRVGSWLQDWEGKSSHSVADALVT